MKTKKEIINLAYEELGMASYVYDLDAASLQSAKTRLDDMVASWEGNGVTISYNFDGDINSDVGCPSRCNNALYLGLALNVAPTIGKVVSSETKANYANAYNAMLNGSISVPIRSQPNTMPRGAGNRCWGLTPNFYTEPNDLLGDNGAIEL